MSMIDTLEYVKTLEAAGIAREVAEAHASAMSKHVIPQLATAADLKATEQQLRLEIRQATTELRQDIAALKVAIGDLKVWGMATMLGVAIAAVTIAKVIH